ncbi:Nucleotide-binding universal stress protein, UspA family [Desulfacinum infernum DSM 9756]|uniref:Nucleotide-binding universal stress protein, UspA family n=1 Tax=Desulfacinum infernum DSM 9756 TaxID=1121391 RepID=A0A1M5FV36_9BACT|nr:universal stress protein [Desulfacinum infernum]SHF95041.1 Nucleotide-binding universal stress protein, UspA family [Desulfacinum infernum DSM 9756]
MLQRILVAFKFSPAGARTLLQAAELARVHGARLHIFHALDYRLLHPATPDERIVAMTREAEERFEKEYKKYLEGYPRYGFNCWEADPSVEICKLAEDMAADLVVIGCHQVGDRPGISRLGMVGLAIVQTAPCMVLVVPCP